MNWGELPRRKRNGVMNSRILISPEKAWGFQLIISGKVHKLCQKPTSFALHPPL
ncbi:MAG: hypothetical protein JGK08_00715 [Microcoleus sp. PH2017_04_SCI_O_A]|nr:hypothetical protein [Microcoleus sp. PH2017_04_SCI_O_A]